MNEIFVDTGAWFALFVPTDPNHENASRWYDQNRQVLLTTDYVINETLTLLKARRENRRAIIVGHRFFSGFLAIVHHLNREAIRLTGEIFERFSDKEWSFTDCSSKLIIEKLNLARSFAFDQHFQQFGPVEVVP